MRSLITDCFVLKSLNYSEADKIFSLFTEKLGKVSAIAKGVRRTRSKKGGNLDLFSFSRISLVEGKRLFIVTQADNIETFPKIKKDLHKLPILYITAEILDKLLPEEQENTKVYSDLYSSLVNIDRNIVDKNEEEIKELSNNLYIYILSNLGYWPPSSLGNRKPNGSIIQTYIEEITERKINSYKFMEKVEDLY